MESLVATIVVLIQLVLAGFLMWGGWLVIRDRFPGLRAKTPADDFERVVSLVLLALLCSTLAAV